MKSHRFLVIVPLLSWAACNGSNGANTVQENTINQRLLITYLAADTALTGAAGTPAASTGEAGTTGAAGSTTGAAGSTTGAAGSTTGAAGTPVTTTTGAAGTGSLPYQAIATGNSTVDPNLVNGWGLAFNPSGPIWVAANGTGLGVVYDSSGALLPTVVTVPPPAGQAGPSAPTGLVFNSTPGFMGDKFIFATEGGTIAGWQSGTEAVTRVDNSASGAIYKGLTISTVNGVTRIYATDFHNGKVDVWDDSYNLITTTGFQDTNLPSRYAPFGIAAINGSVYVTYAKQDDAAEDDDPGQGHGYLDVYDPDGLQARRLVSQDVLNSPWALAMAPSDFGAMSGLLLVGNFGDGRINGIDPNTGGLISQALDADGNALRIDGLWSLSFGNGTPGAALNELFFTSGPNKEMNGAFGRLDLAP
jgi:uncharacterized protein (TIGR03118 family)